MNATTIAIADIDASGRVRDADPETVAAYAMVAEERVSKCFSPLMQPIVIRPVDGGYRLIDGANRLAALKEIGRSEVIVGLDAIVREETDEAALDSELFANLANAGLTPFDRQIFIYKVYENFKATHGETRGRKSKIKQLQDGKKRATFALFSSPRFYKGAADRIGMSEKTVKEAVRIAKGVIEADAVEEVRGTMLEHNLNELKQLVAMPIEKRRAAAAAIKRGEAKTVCEASVVIGLANPRSDDPQARLYASAIDVWGKLDRRNRAAFLDAIGVPKEIAAKVVGNDIETEAGSNAKRLGRARP